MVRATPEQVAAITAIRYSDQDGTEIIRHTPKLAPFPAERRYIDAAAHNRAWGEAIVERMEADAEQFRALKAVPLDVLDRMERLIVAVHASNLCRVGAYSDEELADS